MDDEAILIEPVGQSRGVTQTARRLYRNARPIARTLQSFRPYICPFEDLLAWVPERAHVLDVGCGAGLFLGLVIDTLPGTTGVGFDSSAEAIIAARQMVASNDFERRLTFEERAVGDTWPTGPFDVVSIVDVLHHIPVRYQRDMIEQAVAHVRPGGLLIYKDMAARPHFSAMWNRLHDLVLARQWIHYRSSVEVAGWLQDFGAQIMTTAARSNGPYAHELIVARRPDDKN